MVERRQDYQDIKETLSEIREDLKRFSFRFDSVIHGDPSGDQNKPGLIVRLDRVEQSAKTGKRLLGGVFTMFVAVLADTIHKTFFK